MRSRGHHTANSRRFVSYFVVTTTWHSFRRVRTQGESCLDTVCLARLRRTYREGRAVDRFVVSRCVVLETPAITGEVPEQQPNKTPSAREPHYQTERASSRPLKAFKRPGAVQDLKTQRPRYIETRRKHNKKQSRGHRQRHQ